MSGLHIDTARVVVLAEPNRVNEAFVARVHARRSLAGVVWESKGAAARLRVWRRRAERHGVLPTASRFAALLLDASLAKLADAEAPDPVSAEPAVPSLRVPDVNMPVVVDVVTTWRPSLVIVSGTGLLGAEILRALQAATVLNVHVGMTPAYRGTHGGAWAMLEGRPDLLCTTIHMLDAGIDTGRPVAFVPAEPQRYLRSLAEGQIASGLRWLEDLLANQLVEVPWPTRIPERGPLRYPPTLKEWRRFRRAARQSAYCRPGA